MNIRGLQRSGLLSPEADGKSQNTAQSGLPFSSPTQAQHIPNMPGSTAYPLSGMSLVSQLASPPAAGSHAAALQQLHLQSTAGVQPGQSLLSSFPKVSPARNLAGRFGVRSSAARATHPQDYYYRKWRRLKKLIKDTVFINGSVCDEVIRIEEKLARSKEERRFLLRKLLQYQSLSEAPTPPVKQEVTTPSVKTTKSPVVLASPASETTMQETATPIPSKSKSAKKKAPPTSTDKKKSSASKELIESMQPKPKKSKSAGANRRIAIPLIPLDPTGRPVFPLVLGDLTVHSLGELNPDRSCFHSAEAIFPVGFCSTRVYGNMTNTDVRCLYTCKISDSGSSPVFEIAPDDCPDKVWKAKSPAECHSMLQRAIVKAKGVELTPTATSGVDFFGLTHPIVQNLIQSLPGARKCAGYKWHKFEVNKGEVIDNIIHCKNDPMVNYEALRKLVAASGAKAQTISASAHLEPSTSLRSLLTSGPFSTAMYTQK
ncbi:transforming growth factor beta regulator 1-like [Haliotis asinina]|uniref:transforming growth factor beta regulator 1-like n=1 Tax=Haliotis asinina TaxID=109174 RepID=UPI003531F92C